jgi:hypothetical protein
VVVSHVKGSKGNNGCMVQLVTMSTAALSKDTEKSMDSEAQRKSEDCRVWQSCKGYFAVHGWTAKVALYTHMVRDRVGGLVKGTRDGKQLAHDGCKKIGSSTVSPAKKLVELLILKKWRPNNRATPAQCPGAGLLFLKSMSSMAGE